jgi:hypothetical protein
MRRLLRWRFLMGGDILNSPLLLVALAIAEIGQ